MNKRRLMRSNLPVFGDPAQRAAYERDVKALLVRTIENASLDGYLTKRRSRLKPLVPASLPEAILADTLTDDTLFRFTGIGYGAISTDEAAESVSVTALDRQWEFDIAVAALLDRLLAGEAVSMAELRQAADADAAEVDAFITQLLYDGFVGTVAAATERAPDLTPAL